MKLYDFDAQGKSDVFYNVFVVILIRLKYLHDSLNIALILDTGHDFFLCWVGPISFDIYGMKLNEVNFSSVSVITHFLDTPYQEINFKSQLNSLLLYKSVKRPSDLHMSSVLFWFYSFVLTFTKRLKSANYKSNSNIL